MRAALILAALLIAAPALADEVCPKAPNPVVTLSYVSRYAPDDASRATIDPGREAEAEAAVAPVDAFISLLADEAAAMYEGPAHARQVRAACIVDQMGDWARADALSDLRTETVRLTVGARYAGLALILWQTLPYAHDHPDRDLVLAWLGTRLRNQMAFWDTAAPGARQGNLRAWAGLAAAALSVQTGEAVMRDWAETAVTEVMCSATPDGSLPQEMSRGRLALHYQLHAIAPLVTAAALLERQGVPASRACDGALDRIVDFAASDLEDGRKTRKITGKRQSLFRGKDRLQPYQVAWIEPYLTLGPNAGLEELADTMRPLVYSKLGGNQTALWGR